MKKMYLMKGMAVLAMGLVAASCNKLDFDQDAYQRAKEQESKESFMNNVMGGQDIDPNQTWKTTKSVSITVTPRKDGTLKIYTANPIGNVVAPLYTTNAVAGQETTFTVTRPSDVETLYAAVVTEEGLIADQLAFNATEASVLVDMTMEATNRSISRRAATAPTQPNYAEETNPITKPSTPTDLPTANTASVVIEGNVTSEWGYENQAIFLAENAVLTITQEWGAIKNSAVYMSKGSKIVKSVNLYLYQVLIYNDGGTIEGPINIEGATLWNKGTIGNVNNSYNIAYSDNSGVTVYNSGTIYANNITVGQYGKLWNEGTITANGTLKGNNSSSQIYNAAGHTITAAALTLDNNYQQLWNDGTVTITGAINVTNSNASVVNHGTLKGKSYNGSAGAKFYNALNANVEIEGATEVNNSNSPWVNDGTYKTGSFKVYGGSNQVFNNCRLTATDKFIMGNNDGSRFVLQGDASVICDEFEWNGDNYFWLGGGSLLKVAKTLKSNNTNWEKGFFNTTSEYAVISAKSITTDYPNSQWRAWYEGKIYVDADSHFDFVKINDGQKNTYFTDDVVFTKKQGTAPVEWEESTCRPAYKGVVVEKDPIMYYYYAFEDLGAIGDFDFNDVVLRLAAPENGVSKVQLVAAGGTLPVQVIYNGSNVGDEVHKEFGVDTKTMVNTGSGEKKDFVELGTVDIASDANMAELPFGIKVTGNNGETVTVTNEVDHTGTAPLMIIVAGYSAELDGVAKADVGKWFWAKERVNISSAYSQFGAWGANVSENTNWYYYFTDGKVWTY